MKKDALKAQITIYHVLGDEKKIRVRIEDENVWLSQKLIAGLPNIYSEGELDENSTIRNFRIVQKESTREIERDIKHYNLDAILAVGCRVRSDRGTQFRKWAEERLREYLIKGFTMDDERLKQAGGRARYFEELLQRIRDIRSSERMFYQKVTDIYATSIDYKVDAELTQKFFATVQNKMHYAVHGCTAAEIIAKRVDAKKPLMGLTSFKGNYITVADTHVAKNYLTEQECDAKSLEVYNFVYERYRDAKEPVYA